jgi:hypothetical protein
MFGSTLSLPLSATAVDTYPRLPPMRLIGCNADSVTATMSLPLHENEHFADKPASVLPAIRDLCVNCNLDCYVRANTGEPIVTPTGRAWAEALDRELASGALGWVRASRLMTSNAPMRQARTTRIGCDSRIRASSTSLWPLSTGRGGGRGRVRG